MVCGVDATCRDQCATSRDCISGQVCAGGTCADRTELVDGSLPVSSEGGPPVSGPCLYSSDCPEPLVCRSGTCVVECREDRDCDYFAACVQGRCRLGGSVMVGGSGGSASTGGSGAGATSGSGGVGAGAVNGGGGTAGSGGTGQGGTGGAPPVVLLDCGSRGTTGATIADTDITTDQTWSGVVHVTQNVIVHAGAVITIQPGTTIVVDTGRTIDFGWNSGGATVLAAGTASAPIRFCGSTATPGNWGTLMLEQTVTTDSVLENVLVSDAGGVVAGGSTALQIDSAVTVNNVQVRNSGADGVWAEDFHAGSAALSVEGAAGVPVLLRGEGAITRFPLGGALTGNGQDLVRVNVSYVDANTTFHEPGIPYLQVSSLYLQGAATLTFEAGVEYRVAAGGSIEAGWNNGGSTFAVDGTTARPVTFRGEAAEAGSWDGILIDANVTAASHIRHAKILHAGGTGPALDIRTPVTLEDVSLDLNKAGVNISNDGLNSDSTSLTVTGTQAVPLTVGLGALTTIPTGGSYTGNTTDEVDVAGYATYTGKGVIPDLGVPYFLEGDVYVQNSGSFEVAAGTEFIASGGIGIVVGQGSTPATFLARGTAAAPIVFRGLDTTNGYWDGIQILATALSTSALDHVTIKNAGLANSGALVLRKEISVTNSTVTGSAGYGIYASTAFTTNYATSNTLTGNTQGAIGTF